MEEEKKEAGADKAEKPAASEASIKTEAMEEEAGEKGGPSKSEATGSKASETASTSEKEGSKIKSEAKSVLSGEAGADGEMDEAAMRRALQVSQYLKIGISFSNFGISRNTWQWLKRCKAPSKWLTRKPSCKITDLKQ